MYYDLSTLEEIDTPNALFLGVDKLDAYHKIKNNFDVNNIEDIFKNYTVRYEDHLTYEMICLSLDLSVENEDTSLFVFLSKKGIHLIGNEQYLNEKVEVYKTLSKTRKRNIGSALHQLILFLIEEYAEEINLIINELSMLEDQVLENEEDTNFSKKILHYRKILLFCKRRYESLMDIFDNLLENINEIYDSQELARLAILKDRSSRMLSQITSMLEYVTEIREAYQSEVDNRQNKIMSLFTVITAIFLPLTLIVGWYGMNFAMPEFESRFAYPIVIIVSILIVVGCVYYFKRKKWF